MATDPNQLLYVFAEVYIGFLGFSGLAGVMSKSSWKAKEVALRYWILLEMGFMGLMLSFIPALLSGLIENQNTGWLIGNIFGLGCWMFQSILYTPKIIKAQKAGEMKSVPKSLYPIYQLPALLSMLSFIFGLTGICSYSYLFLTGLFFFTLAGIGNFICFLVANQKYNDMQDGEKDT